MVGVIGDAPLVCGTSILALLGSGAVFPINGKFRDECLNLHWFRSLQHAREEIALWRNHYNTQRPHSALGYLSPTEFLMKTTAPALETLAVSALSPNTANQPENSRANRP